MKTKELLKTYSIITLGCAMYALAFDWFYVPNNFTVGGFTGLAQIIHFFVPALPVGMTALALNAPLYVLAFRRFGFSFIFKSFYATAVSSVFLDVLAAVHTFAPTEPLIGCIYGGVLLGAGCGVMLHVEATTGGTELASWLLKRHFPHLSLGSVLLALDLMVIASYALAFHNINNALYGGVALFVTTKVLDLIVYGGNTGKLAHIISAKEAEIAKALLESGVGVTKLRAIGAYTNTERPMLLCAVRRREIVMVKRIVKGIDPDAFFIMCDAGEVLGEGFGEYKANDL